MNDEVKGKCWQCGANLAALDYGRETNCHSCGKPTRVCRNCRWYAPSRPAQCEEPMADRVMDKEKANFCGYFEPTMEIETSTEPSSQDALRQAAEDLFKS
jgi:DNA-directed RNA polymerase subunit RPC12/RpoP